VLTVFLVRGISPSAGLEGAIGVAGAIAANAREGNGAAHRQQGRAVLLPEDRQLDRTSSFSVHRRIPIWTCIEVGSCGGGCKAADFGTGLALHLRFVCTLSPRGIELIHETRRYQGQGNR